MDFNFTEELTAKDAVIIFCYENDTAFGKTADNLDKQTGQAIFKSLNNGKFKGQEGQIFTLNNPFGTEFSQIVLVGLGKKESMNTEVFMSSLAIGIKEVSNAGFSSVSVIMENVERADIMSARGALAVSLATYRFDKYKTCAKNKENGKLAVVSFVLKAEDIESAKQLSVDTLAVAEGVKEAKDIISEPSNVIYPESFTEKAEELSSLGVTVEVLTESDLRSLGLNLIYAVGKGSVYPPRLLILKWKGKSEEDVYPLCLVGKGVCFDSGGISLKPARGMGKMKYDLSGACAVLGAIKALAIRKAKANVVALLPLAENMPDGGAVKPGDVIKSFSGKTVEIDNTDAEGRLILADAIAYGEKTFHPEVIIDIATLTGAITVGLGSLRAGLFCNDTELEKELFAAGESCTEQLWAMPMDQDYFDHLKSDIADITNCSNTGEAGSITAAKFLEFFLREDKEHKTKWAHLDVAGVDWLNSDKPLCPKGPRAFGVMLFDKFIRDNFEK